MFRPFQSREITRLIRRIKKVGPDMRKPVYPDGYQPPPIGWAHARLIAYLELGLHKLGDVEAPLVDMVFELSGPGYELRQHEGRYLVPHRVTLQEVLSLAPDARFFKLFAAMNYSGDATHMVELLGEAFLVHVFHRKSADGKKTYATLRGSSKTRPFGAGYLIAPPSYRNPVSGKEERVVVSAPLTELKAFIWDIADKEMWDSVFIEGEYPERKDEKTGELFAKARSKNVIQEKIARATNWLELKHRLKIAN